jgi:hypothetical protein
MPAIQEAFLLWCALKTYQYPNAYQQGMNLKIDDFAGSYTQSLKPESLSKKGRVTPNNPVAFPQVQLYSSI